MQSKNISLDKEIKLLQLAQRQVNRIRERKNNLKEKKTLNDLEQQLQDL